MQPASGEAEPGENFPISRLERRKLASETADRERQQDGKNDEQPPDDGDARRDVLAHRARHDPVSRPQRERREQHQPRGETHGGALSPAC
jgi:hypothetical protein